MVIADISVLKNEKMLLHTTTMAKRLYTESIANQVRSNFSPKAVSTRLKRMNIKNLLFELKLNMFSLLSKTFSLFVKLDIEVNESSLLNWIFCLLSQIFILLLGVLAFLPDYGLLCAVKTGTYLSLLLFWYFLLPLFFFIFIYAVLP